MSFTGIVFLIFYGVGLILTFYNPYYGVLTYIFEWHNHPPYMWWGKEWPNIRWSFTIALITVISLIINRKKLPQLINADFKPAIWLILLAMNAYFVSYSSALVPDESFRKSEILLKYGINFILMTQLIRSPKDYRLVIWVILLCTANFGRIAWEIGGNRDLAVRAPQSDDENQLSAYVMTVMPFYFFYFFTGKRWQKILIFLSVPFCLNLIILANSRGTFMGLLVIAFFTIIWTRGKMRLYLVLGVVVGALMFLRLSNEQFWSRQSTTENYEQESSASSRIYLWQGAFKMMKDYPFGVGGEGYELLAQEYVPELAEKMQEVGNKTVHNTFLNIGTEWGYLGLFLFLGLFIHCFALLHKVKVLAKKFASLNKYYFEAVALQLAFLGIFTAGLFHNRSYAEIIYWLAAFSVVLRNIVVTELANLRDDKNLSEIERNVFEGEPVST